VKRAPADFKAYEVAFLTGQGVEYLDEFQNEFGLQILRRGRRPFCGGTEPSELRRRWQKLGKEAFRWPEDIEEEFENEEIEESENK